MKGKDKEAVQRPWRESVQVQIRSACHQSLGFRVAMGGLEHPELSDHCLVTTNQPLPIALSCLVITLKWNPRYISRSPRETRSRK